MQSATSAYGALVLRDRDRWAGRARQGRS